MLPIWQGGEVMRDILWNIIEAVNVLLEISIVEIYFRKLLKSKYENKAVNTGGYLAAAVILYLTGLMTTNPAVLISMTFALLVSIVLILYEGSVIRKIFLSLLFIVLIFISEIFLIGIMAACQMGLPSEIVAQGAGRLVGMVGTKIIYFWIVVFVCRLLNRKLKEVPLKHWMMIVLLPIVSALILYIMFCNLMEVSENKGMILYCVAVLGLLYLNFAMFDFFETYQEQLRVSVLEQVIEHENANYKLIEEVYSDIRKLNHDIRNQVNVVNELVMHGDRGSAEAVLKNISAQLEGAGTVCYTGEPIIDSMINIKLRLAHESGIKISKRIRVSEFKADRIELCRLLGNALDNAIEGCQRSACAKPKIHLSIQQIDGKLVIEIVNDSDAVNPDKLQTQKRNKAAHGIGMSSMKASVHKMEGHMSCGYEDGIFSLKIVL